MIAGELQSKIAPYELVQMRYFHLIHLSTFLYDIHYYRLPSPHDADLEADLLKLGYETVHTLQF